MYSHAEPFSWTVFLLLLLILGSSVGMFLTLVRRWTIHRRQTALAEWAPNHGLHFDSTASSALPEPLGALKDSNVQILVHLAGDGVALLQLETAATSSSAPGNRWNVALRRRPTEAKGVAGLRPIGLSASVLDSFRLSQYPTPGLGTRFAILASSSSAARALGESASRTLVPSDLGLLLLDHWIVLDFSARAFDPIELDRMLALSKQLSQLI